MSASPKGRAGQSAIELMFYGGVVVAALIAMSVYVQRGYQGYLYSSGSAHGSQFDYRNDSWNLTQQLNHFDQHQDINAIPSSSGPGLDMPKGNDDLPTVPGGRVPGRMLETKATVTTSWDVKRKAHDEAK